MKNIHVLPTDKPSRLYKSKITQDVFISDNLSQHGSATYNVNIYITSDEKPKAGDWSLYQNKIHKCIEDIIGDEFKKIILTTDQDLISGGIQPIDNYFLEWFVKNPSCESVEIEEFSVKVDLLEYKTKYKIIIPKEEQKQHLIDIMRGDEELGLYEEPKQEKPVQVKGGDNVIFPSSTTITFKPKQETLEEIVREYYPDENQCIKRIAFRRGYTECKEKMYSEEDMKQFAWECVANFLSNNVNEVEMALVEVIIDRNSKQFEKFKKK